MQPVINILFTTLVTEKRKNAHLGTEKYVNRNRVEIVLSTIFSLRNLPIKSAEFYIEFDETTSWGTELIHQAILELPFSLIINNYRLENFNTWRSAAEKVLAANPDLLMLFSNDDHIYIDSSNVELLYLSNMAILAQRKHPNKSIFVPLSHYPETHALIPFAKAMKKFVNFQGAPLVPSITPIGAILITPEKFFQWWENDFTYGSKIVGPENPFGPSVVEESGVAFIPRKELFRHMDAYSHIGLMNWPYQVLAPTHTIKNQANNLTISYQKYIYVDFCMDLPKEFIGLCLLNESGQKTDLCSFRSAVLKANSIRFSLDSIRWLNTLYQMTNKELTQSLILVFFKSSNFRNALRKRVFELPIIIFLILARKMNFFHKFNHYNISLARLFILSSSHGFYRYVRIIGLDIIVKRLNRYKNLKKVLKT